MKQRNFWNDADGFSITDALAIVYSITYLGLIIANVKLQNKSITDLLNILSPTIYIIVSGYFAGQAIQRYGEYRTTNQLQQYPTNNQFQQTPQDNTINDIDKSV